jgi:LacI family transcriptional regulator
MPEILDPQTEKSVQAENQPLYLMLAEQLREKIRTKELKVGDRLPTFAEMRDKFGVTLGTVERTYSFLEKEGLIERQQGRGTFVAQQKRKLTGNLGVIGCELLRQQQMAYYSQLMRGMEEAAMQNGQHLLFLGTDLDLDVRSCEKVDGVLVVGIDLIDEFLTKLPPGLATVAVLNAAEGIPSVIADDYQGAKLAVKYLLSHGHTRIACLMERIPTLSRRRIAAYTDALLGAGIEAETDWMRLTPTIPTAENGQAYLQWGRQQMRDWLRSGWRETGCTALFVQNETGAIGALQVLQEEGVRVPDEVSVIGFDGTELCDYTTPRLCAVEVPLAQIGAKAIEVLNRQIHGDEARDVHSVLLPLRIREGASVADASPTSS